MKQTIKINALLGLMGLFCNYASAQTTAAFSIQGKLNNAGTGKVMLMKASADGIGFKAVDSGVLKNGSFELKGKIAAPEMMTLKVNGGDWSMPVFVEQGILKVTADLSNQKLNKITGSASQDQYDTYLKDQQQLKMDEELAELRQKIRAEKDPAKIQELKQQSSTLALAKKSREKAWLKTYVAANSGSVASAYAFYKYHQFDYEMSLAETDEILNSLTGEAKASRYYKIVEKEVLAKKALMPGKLAPDFSLSTKEGNKIALSSLRGKYVLIDFWASWCKPCRAAIPHWKEIYPKYKDKGFEILALSGDRNHADWIKAMDVEQMPWLQVVDDFPPGQMNSVVGGIYQVSFIPFYVLLDKAGKILVFSGDKKEIDAKLAELFD